MYNKSTLFIVNNIDKFILEMKQTLPNHSVRVIKNKDDNKKEFLMGEAQRGIQEAYISTSTIKYILLCGDSFRVEAQNALLKVLEEPPRNIIFLIITLSKNAILPTILSRIQIKYLKIHKNTQLSNLNIEQLGLKEVYNFLKQNQRISKYEAKEIIESILYTINHKNIRYNQQELNSFSKAMKLLELNSRPINVLTTLLLNIIKRS
jgi:DNA polymerase-3 subunit delta'